MVKASLCYFRVKYGLFHVLYIEAELRYLKHTGSRFCPDNFILTYKFQHQVVASLNAVRASSFALASKIQYITNLPET